jgi:hypothetical protein
MNRRAWLAVTAFGFTWPVSAYALPLRAAGVHYSPPSKPAGVPDDYVITPNGFFHPSCVVNVHADEIMGPDLIIRGLDGAARAHADPCAYPRFGLRGARIDAEVAPQASTYNGWIVQYAYVGSIPSGPNLTDTWVVPDLPPNQGSQTLYFFNGIQGSSILQPVMGYIGGGPWNLASWNCCTQGDTQHSDYIDLSPGDVITGTITSAGCDSSGVCQTWTVTSTDETTGKSVVLNGSSDVGTPNIVVPAVLETYGVTSCDMFPVTGEETFYDHSLTDPGGTAVTLKYKLKFDTGGNGQNGNLPACGYTGATATNSYSLIFSPNPTGGGPPVGFGLKMSE